ncbi:Fic family protein [Haloplanus litoreus]
MSLIFWDHRWCCHPEVRAGLGLIHYQFETIHPFLDGNGLGRLSISLLLQREGLLPEPHLYLSSYVNARRSEYVGQMRPPACKLAN